MRTLFLLIVLVVSVIIALIWTVPLEVALRQAGVGGAGVGWANVEGTIRKGRINGLFTPGQAIGDISMELRPLSLLTLSPVYDVQWGGAGGRGSGTAKISGTKLILSDIRMVQQVSAIEGLAMPVRAVGGTLELRGGSATLTQEGCSAASGQLTTDVLSRAAQQYGREFGSLAGPLSCQDGAFQVELEGQSQAGDRVDLDTQASLDGRADFTASVVTQDPELMLVLKEVGFTFTDGAWAYRYEVVTGVN